MNAYDFSKVLAHFKTGVALAKALGTTPQAIYQWKGHIPPRRALEIEKITNGLFKAERVR